MNKFIGQTVEVEYVSYGNLRKEIGILRSVENHVRIELEGSSTPFIGYGCAIRSIRVMDSNGIIYTNINIPEDYDERSEEGIHEYILISFGEEVANERKRLTEESKIKWQAKRE